MNDIATDFRESARIDVNDVLDDIREDIQIITDKTDDLKEEVARLGKAIIHVLDIVTSLAKERQN